MKVKEQDKQPSYSTYLGAEFSTEELKKIQTLSDRLDYPITEMLRDNLMDFVNNNYEFFTDNKKYQVFF